MRMFQAHNLNRVSRVRFSANARALTVSVRRIPGVVHFDVCGGNPEVWERGSRHEASQVAFSPDGTLLTVGDVLGRIQSFLVGSQTQTEGRSPPFFRTSYLDGSELRVCEFDHNPMVILSGLVYSPVVHTQRMRLAAAGSDLLIWNPHTQEYIVAPEEGDYRGVSFGPDGTTVASIEYHAHALCVWNVKPFHVLFRTELRGIDTFDNGSVVMLPDGGRVIYAAGSHLRCVPLTGTGGWETVSKKPPLEIALHPNGRMLLVADGSKKVTAYDTDNGRPATQYDWGIGKVGCVTYSPDGTLAAGGGEKGQVVVWDAE